MGFEHPSDEIDVRRIMVHNGDDKRGEWYRGLDHRAGHPTPFEPVPMLVAED